MRKLTVNKEGMSRLPKRIQQAKRVAPPAVPEIYRHSGSSFSSAGYGSCDDTSATTNVGNYYTTDPNSSLTATIRSGTNANCNTSIDMPDNANNRTIQANAATSIVSGGASSSTNQSQSSQAHQQAFIFHVQNPHQQPLTHKAAVYYHQQLALQEDQGIDLTQSPGRDSPGSSSGSAGSGSRHSTASLDSGRASSYHTGTSTSSVTSKRMTSGSGGGVNAAGLGCNIGLDAINSVGGGGILSSPRCSSLSSCSIGSADQMSHRTDHEIITDWLRELCFDEYAPLFSEAGYDMPTISRMTPEDLTAIGIKKPRHRERIKQHIDALQLPDNLPHYVPGSIEEWLRLLRLDEYAQQLLAQGYRTVRDVTQLPWEDMEDIGIVKLGHQKKLLLAIKRIKDILSGKWIAPGIANSPQDCMVNSQMMMNWDHPQSQQYFEQMHLMNAMPSHLSPLSTDSNISNQQFYQQLNYQQPQQLMAHNTIMEKDNNDIVLIKLRQPRGRSLDSPDDSDENRLIVTFSQHHNSQGTEAEETLHEMTAAQAAATASGQYHLAQNMHHMHQQTWRQYVDGDITPTNEMCNRSGRDINSLPCDIDRDSLLRHRGMTVPQRTKPIAMVKGNVLHTLPHHQQPQQQPDSLKSSEVSADKCLSECYGINCHRPRKKIDDKRSIAPEPPRRHCSNNSVRPNSSLDQICEDYDALTISGQQTKSSYHSSDIYNSYNQMHSLQYYETSSNCQMSLSMPQQPIYANYNAVVNAMQSQQSQPNIQLPSANHIQTRAEVHAEKVHFSNSNDSKSNSSIDSIDALPFANDNAGTIKQRANQYNQMTHSNPNISLDNSDTSKSTIIQQQQQQQAPPSQTSVTIQSLNDSCCDDVLKSGCDLNYKPSNSSSTTISTPNMSRNESVSDTTNKLMDDHHHHQHDAVDDDDDDDDEDSLHKAAINATTIDSNVLNDIGNMLANLTDELDAMLEEEKRVGLNDSE